MKKLLLSLLLIPSLAFGQSRFLQSSTDSVTATCNAGTNLNTSALATSANQTTVIGHVDGIEGLLTTIDTDTGNIATSVSSIDGKIDTFNLTTTDPISVAITDGNGDQITSFGGGTQYTEADTDSSITGTAMLWEDTSDTLRAVSAAKPLPVNIVSGSSSGTEYTEADTDASFTGPICLMEGAGNAAVPLQGTAADGLLVNLGANNDVSITGTVACTQSGTWDEIGINDSGNTITVDGTVTVTDGAGALNVIIDSGTTAVTATNLDVQIGGSDSLTIGTFPDNEPINVAQMNGVAVSMGSGANGTGVQRVTIATDDEVNDDADATRAAVEIMDDWDNGASDGASVSGDVAHDTADAGEPVKMGAKAVVVGTTPTEVTANDRTQLYAIRAGIPFVLPGHMNHLMASENITDADGAQTNAALITVSTGTKIVVTSYVVKCDQDNTGDYDIRIGFGTANTPSADNDGDLIAELSGIAPGSGVTSGPIMAIGGDDEDVRLTMDDPAGGACSIWLNYFTTSS